VREDKLGKKRKCPKKRHKYTQHLTKIMKGIKKTTYNQIAGKKERTICNKKIQF
jgi:hypothetical protein